MIRVGLIGAGFIGRNHFNQYERLAGRARVHALCDSQAERLIHGRVDTAHLAVAGGADSLAQAAERACFGECLHESGLNRYGIIKIKPDLQSGPVKISEEADGWTLTDSEAALHVNADDGKVCLKEKKGGVVLEGCEQKTKSDGHGFAISFRLGKGERLYGKHGV